VRQQSLHHPFGAHAGGWLAGARSAVPALVLPEPEPKARQHLRKCRICVFLIGKKTACLLSQKSGATAVFVVASASPTCASPLQALRPHVRKPRPARSLPFLMKG
jgi:hypothetical protein